MRVDTPAAAAHACRPSPSLSRKRERDCGAFLHLVRRFDLFGTATREAVVDGIPYLTNEFWTAGQRKAHPLHEVSYRACFKPQLPEFFVAGLTRPGEGVLDPFMGRGTTPLQAAIMGRRPLGSDVNPLSTLLVRPRLSPPPLDAIERALSAVHWDAEAEAPADLLAFYHPDTLRHLCALRAWLLRTAPLDDPCPDPVADWIRMLAVNRLTGHSPGFFSVYTLPPNQAASVANQRRINARRGQVPPPRDVPALILRKSHALLKLGPPPPHPAPLLGTAPAHAMPHVPDGAAALAVTSPPFLDVVQYADDNWLRCWFAGIDVEAVPIALHRTEGAWQRMVADALRELARAVRPGGHVAFEVGEVRRGSILLERAVWRAAEGLPFERLAVLVNAQRFTKTANVWGIGNGVRGTNTNRVVLLRWL